MDTSKVPERFRNAVHEMIFDRQGKSLSLLTRREWLEQWLNYQGIYGYTDDIIELLDTLSTDTDEHYNKGWNDAIDVIIETAEVMKV